MKNFISFKWGASVMSLAIFGMLTACGGNASKSNDGKEISSLEDSLALIEQEKNAANDTRSKVLKAIEEMEAAVDDVKLAPADQLKKYDASFFDNADNKADLPTAGKYVVTDTGLKFAIVDPGKGKHPTATDVVTVNYIGMLPDGTVFDSSIDRGEPIDFPLNGVIRGWTEGLQYMAPGATAVFYIPYDLAYGERGIPGAIPPSSPLIFWVNLLSVK